MLPNGGQNFVRGWKLLQSIKEGILVIIGRIIIGHYLRRSNGEEDLDVAHECDFVRPVHGNEEEFHDDE